MQAIETITIERAFTAIAHAGLAPHNQVTSKVMGYTSSFGAAVIQSGLVAAVIFFSEESRDGDAVDRPKVMQALLHMTGATQLTLVEYLRANLNNLERIEEQLLENAIALKMALRSYEKREETTNPMEA